jgi:hypothetical protein
MPDDDSAEDFGELRSDIFSLRGRQAVGYQFDRVVDTGKGVGVFVSHVNPLKNVRLLENLRSGW